MCYLCVCPLGGISVNPGRHTGLPLRWLTWLHLFFKDHKRRATFLAPLRGGSKAGNLCNTDCLKVNNYPILNRR